MRIKFANTYLDSISFVDTVEEVKKSIIAKKKTHIVFLNALKIYEIESNPDMREPMEKAELILADGVPIVWASRLYRTPIPGRVNGTDLFERLLSESAANGYKIFLLGAKQAVLEKLTDVLRGVYPALQIAGYRNGYFKDPDDEAVIAQINESKADILFIGFSSPKKEVWAYKYKSKIQVPIIQGVGGSFDVLAGLIPRAPRWMQKSGLEWFFRVIKEPRRMFKRYFITNSAFVFIIFKYFFKNLFRSKK